MPWVVVVWMVMLRMWMPFELSTVNAARREGKVPRSGLVRMLAGCGLKTSFIGWTRRMP